MPNTRDSRPRPARAARRRSAVVRVATGASHQQSGNHSQGESLHGDEEDGRQEEGGRASTCTEETVTDTSHESAQTEQARAIIDRYAAGDRSTALAIALVARFFNYLASFTIGGLALSPVLDWINRQISKSKK